MSEILDAERHGGVLRLTLNRPKQRNALSRALMAELTEALQAANTDAAVRVIVLTGAPPAFCAGLDLKEVASSTPEEAEADSKNLVRLFSTLEELRQPIIAEVNGPAVAGGAGLISVCDIVIAAESAVIGYPEIKRGLIGAVVSTYLLRLVGERQARYLLMTGENLGARRALEFGLCNEVTPDGDLRQRVQVYAEMFETYPPDALANTKKLLTLVRDVPHREAVETARQFNAAMRTTGESRDAIGRFFKKGRS